MQLRTEHLKQRPEAQRTGLVVRAVPAWLGLVVRGLVGGGYFGSFRLVVPRVPVGNPLTDLPMGNCSTQRHQRRLRTGSLHIKKVSRLVCERFHFDVDRSRRGLEELKKGGVKPRSQACLFGPVDVPRQVGPQYCRGRRLRMKLTIAGLLEFPSPVWVRVCR